MKKTYLSRLSLYGLPLIIVIIVFAVNSCKKDLRTNANNLKPVSSGDTSLTAQAKAWYQNNYPDLKTTTAKTQSFGAAPAVQDWSKTFSPYWAQAQTFVADSMTIIELPALKKGNMAMMPNTVNTQGYDFSKSPSITSILIVIYKGYINAYAMTIMGDSSYLNGNYARLKNNTYRKKDKNFSGMVFYNAMDGTFINGWRMVNGAVTSAIQQAPASTTPVIQSITRGPKINVTQQCTVTVNELWENCSYYTTDIDDTDPFNCYYYWVTTTYTTSCGTTTTSPGGGTPVTPPAPPKCVPPTVQVDAFTGHLKINVAAPPPTSPTAPGTPQPAPQPCPTNNPTDSVSTIVPSAVNTIKDSVTNLCLKAIIDNLTNNGTIQTDVTSMLRNTFGVNDNVNLIFNQRTLTGDDATSDAITIGQNTDITTTFNTPLIANASKEFLLETTLHEIFHAYLDENPSINASLGQHTYMIQNYVNTEVQTLQTVFPNLSTHDAQCLVLGGFGTLEQSKPTVFNAALSLYGLTASDVQTTNNSYLSGNSGTHC